MMLSVLSAAALLAGCSGPEEADQAWGQEAVVYFDTLARAYSANDYYGVLDFYATDAFQEKRRASIGEGLLIRDLLIWNSGDLGHEVLSTYLGGRGAVNMVRWAQGGLSVVLSTTDGGRIAGETVFDHAAWLESSLRGLPETVALYEDLYASYASDEDLDVISLSQTVNSAPVEGPAVFLGPAAFGQDPRRAIGVYESTDKSGCVTEVAVVWDSDGNGALSNETYTQPALQSGCTDPRPINAWWVGLELPTPRDQAVTSLLSTRAGQQVEIANGTPAIEILLTETLQQFALVGLELPDFERVTFEPTRQCENRSGRLIQDADSRRLFICFFASDLCETASTCGEPPLRVKALILHELAHAWIIDHVDDEERDQLLTDVGLELWDDQSVPWNRRGVEYAAEVISWGLLEGRIPMVRIGSPPCAELAESFSTLTGVEPLGVEEGC